MARYYGSEALRNKKLQKKAINYGLKKLTPVVQTVGSETPDQLSTKIRPEKAYKTNREDLGDPDPHKMVGRKRGGGNMVQELADNLNDILTDPKKYQKYHRIWPNMHWNKHKYLYMGDHWGNSYQQLV